MDDRVVDGIGTASIETRGSRWPAILAGALVPLAAGSATIILAVAVGGTARAGPFKDMGVGGTVLLLLPGTLTLGSVFAFPMSAAMVCCMSWLMRRSAWADSLGVWTVAGLLFSSPLCLLFWMLDNPGGPYVLLSFSIVLGLIGGLSAGLKRPRPDPA